METIEKVKIYQLTEKSVFIDTTDFLLINGKEVKLGETRSTSYSNSLSGRERIQTKQPENIVRAVFEIWGDEPTEPEPEQPQMEETTPEEEAPEEEERVYDANEDESTVPEPELPLKPEIQSEEDMIEVKNNTE